MKSFFILLFLFPLLSFAQKEDRVWVFDDSVAIDWNDTLNPIVFKIGMKPFSNTENYSSISDKNGNLLFYIAQGAQYSGNSGLLSGIYRYAPLSSSMDEVIIPNGDSLCSNRSITQGFLFIPFLNDTNKYYLFYLAGNNAPFCQYGFSYAIIDKSVGTLGACISKTNLLVSEEFSEKMTAVKHGNGVDWWIIIHKVNSSEFYKYLLSAAGISGPYIQSIGPSISYQYQGQMKISPDGNKLGMADANNNLISLFDFNRCTGEFSNYLNLGNYTAYGCSFSPNNKIFYTSSWSKLYQYNLDSPNIALSKLEIWDDAAPLYYIGQHLLAPDGIIYIASGYKYLPNQVFNFRTKNLTVIENPNVYGAGCNVSPYSFYLGGMRCLLGLPNMVNYNLGALIGSPCDTILNCVSTQNNFSESICNGDVFDFNGTPLTITGTYYDTLMNVGGCDSLITLQLNVLNTTSSNTSASICSGDSYSFNGNQLTAAGNYFDTLVNAQGCDSLITLQLNVLNTTAGNTSASICSGDSYSFNGNQLTTAGNYFDTLVNVQGCDSLITLQLSVLNNSAFSSSQKICAGDTLHIGNIGHSTAGIFIDTLLNAAGCDSIVTTLLTVDSVIVSVSSIADSLTATTNGVGITYQWLNCDSSTNITGATNQNFVATATGNYAVIVTDGNNCSKQSECVFVLVSGVEQLTIDNGQLIIYPNPTDGEITVVLRASFDKLRMTTITITDALGRTIISDKTNLNSKIINLKSFAAGVYFVKVQMSDGSFEVKKFVKE